MNEKDFDSLKEISHAEYARFLSFLRSHDEKRIDTNEKKIPYLACGEGKWTLLTFAGGWGGIALAYEFVLGFEGRNRVIVVDVSAFDDPDEMARGVNQVLDREKTERLVVFGQSLSGIIGQSYFKRDFGRVDGLILTNTPAPRRERSKKWALVLLRFFPLGLLKSLACKKLTRLSEFEQEIPAEIWERRRFAMSLLGRMIAMYWSKENLFNILKLAFAFNERDAYTNDFFSDWRGKVLIITSEDDDYYPDVESLMKNLPNTEIFKFRTGFGHVAPQIHRDEFYGVIQGFVSRLDKGPA